MKVHPVTALQRAIHDAAVGYRSSVCSSAFMPREQPGRPQIGALGDADGDTELLIMLDGTAEELDTTALFTRLDGLTITGTSQSRS